MTSSEASNNCHDEGHQHDRQQGEEERPLRRRRRKEPQMQLQQKAAPPTFSVELGLKNNYDTMTTAEKTHSSSSFINSILRIDERVSTIVFDWSLPPTIEAIYSIPACFFGLIPPIIVGPPGLFLLSIWFDQSYDYDDYDLSPTSLLSSSQRNIALSLLSVWTLSISVGFIAIWIIYVLRRGDVSVIGNVFAVKPLYILATPFNLILLRYLSLMDEEHTKQQLLQNVLSSSIYPLVLWYPSCLVVLILKDFTHRTRPCLKILHRQQKQEKEQSKSAPTPSPSRKEYYQKVFHRKAFPIIPTVLARAGKEGYKSFPSGDAMSSACFAIPLAYMKLVAGGNDKDDDNGDTRDASNMTMMSKFMEVLPFVLAAGTVVLACTGRVYFYAHHVLDVLVGAAIPLILHVIFTITNFGIHDMQWWYPLVSISGCISVLGTLKLFSMMKSSPPQPQVEEEVPNKRKKTDAPNPIHKNSSKKTQHYWKIVVKTVNSGLRSLPSNILLSLAVMTCFWILCQADSTPSDFPGLQHIHHHRQQMPPRPLNAVQLAVGTWDVDVRRVGRFGDIEQTIFPQSTMKATSKPDSKQDKGYNMKCYLSIAEDGSFVLTKKDDLSSVPYKCSDDKPKLPFRGKWKLMPNPHCVTDRFYDEIQFESFPRQRITLDRCTSTEDVKVGKLTLHGRLWGRNGMGKGSLIGKQSSFPNSQKENSLTNVSLDAENNEYCRQPYGKLTHGTLAWVEVDSTEKDTNPRSWKPWFRGHHPIVASVSGRRISKDPIHEPWYDE
mmetsp:Transcript_20783/g.49355  ORF Transcript_20783/g.49355 Transcript_20783/m.49355 type:complete len:775 (+) Transcript_20783:114-2438(+)